MPTQFNMIAEVRSFMKNRVILTAAELDLVTELDDQSEINVEKFFTTDKGKDLLPEAVATIVILGPKLYHC